MQQPEISALRGQRVHMVGIGGSSMSGLAEMLARRFCGDRHRLDEGYALNHLRGLGIDARAGHHPEMLDGAACWFFRRHSEG